MKTFWNPDVLRAASGGSWLVRPPLIALPPDRPPDLPLPPLHAPISGLSTDSRSVRPGQVFLALRGERFDGHDFLIDAAGAGSPILIVDDHARVPEAGFQPAVGVLKVADTAKALLKLAAAYRKSLDRTKVIAVCGSNGKTTTTRLIDHILRQSLRGTAPQKSFNNAVGVPLTILSARENDQYLVCEVGTNAPGEIAQLAEVVSPDIAVITSIGREHLELLTDLAGVAREEAGILRFVRPKGTAVVTADPPDIGAQLLELARSVPTVITFGRSESANLRVTRAAHVVEDARVTLAFQVNGRQEVKLPLLGEHNALNAVAAIAVARRVGIDEQKAIAALGSAQPADMRLNLLELPASGGQAQPPVRILNDSYNANPDSMLAGIHTALALRDSLPGVRRLVLVLGQMLELGDASEHEHRELAAQLVSLCTASSALNAAPLVDHLVLVGAAMRAARDELVRREWPESRVTFHLDVGEDSALAVARLFVPGDLVLLKGSRGVRLERVLEALRSGPRLPPSGQADRATLLTAPSSPAPAQIAEPHPDARSLGASGRNNAPRLPSPLDTLPVATRAAASLGH